MLRWVCPLCGEVETTHGPALLHAQQRAHLTWDHKEDSLELLDGEFIYRFRPEGREPYWEWNCSLCSITEKRGDLRNMEQAVKGHKSYRHKPPDQSIQTSVPEPASPAVVTDHSADTPTPEELKWLASEHVSWDGPAPEFPPELPRVSRARLQFN